MPSYIAVDGAQHQVDFTAEELFGAAKAQGLTPVQYINQKHKDADTQYGSAFKQLQASAGIRRPDSENNPYGLSATHMADLLGYQANTQVNSSPFGTASRAFTAITIIDAIESALAKDRVTDITNFNSMVSNVVTLNSEHFEQPVISYDNLGGAEQAKATRVVQGAAPSKMARFTTADRIRRVGSWTVGMEFTDQALRATTLDFVTMTMARYLAVERDERAYRYIADLFNGNGDMITGAVSAVTSNSLDAGATGGVLTHKAWLKFLARNRKVRKITHVIGDLDSYLKVEGRTGRPGTANYDPTLARLDPQAVMTMPVGFGNDVKFILVDSAADGGPVPANTIYAVDATSAISLVRNSGAAYNAVEEFAMRRSSALRLDWSEEAFRTFGDTDLRAFDVLTIS